MTITPRREVHLAAAVSTLLAAGEHDAAREFAGELLGLLRASSSPATTDDRVAELEATVEQLRAELARAKDAARQRRRRRDERTLLMFSETSSGEPGGSDGRSDVSNVSSSDLSDQIFERGSEETPRPRPAKRPAVAVHHELAAPEWAIDMRAEVRPELAECFFRRCWERFVKANASHPSLAIAKRHFRAWLRREDARPLAFEADAGDEPRVELPPISGFRPIMDAHPRTAAETRLHAVGQSLALLALEESTGPPEMAPGGA